MTQANSRIITVYNHKGGVGKTLIAATLCFLAELNRIQTLAVAMDRQGDLIRWLTRGKTISRDDLYEISDYLLAVYSPNSYPGRLRYPLIVVDQSPAWEDAERVQPDLCIVPVDCIDAIINFMSAREWISISSSGVGVYFVLNNADVGGKRDLAFIKKTLARQRIVEVWDGNIPHSGVFRRAYNRKVPVWEASYAEQSTGPEEAILDLCSSILARVGFRVTKRPGLG
ncbi:MAG: AAA family ATPase [Myxococcales bacterium]|nr:AAA family ATPase [Myxococcales bacterium]